MEKTAQNVLILSAAILIAGAAGFWLLRQFAGPGLRADPENPTQVALGQMVYATHCASCHGRTLEGQPDWQKRKASGRLPAPPHDASGHTWHHPDGQLFGIVKGGIEQYASAGYESDMPAFGSTLSDEEIWAVLAYIKSTWPMDIRERQLDISRRSQ